MGNESNAIREAIDQLRFSLEHVFKEDELLRVIDQRLTTLRCLYHSHRSVFTPADIEFLRTVNGTADHLRAFMRLQGELVDIGSAKEHAEIMAELIHIRQALAGCQVSKRIAKAIRELNEILPSIRERDQARRNFGLSMRIADLEQSPQCCPRGHLMKIRQGTSSYFRGCTGYPFCEETAQLTREQKNLLRLH